MKYYVQPVFDLRGDAWDLVGPRGGKNRIVWTLTGWKCSCGRINCAHQEAVNQYEDRVARDEA